MWTTLFFAFVCILAITLSNSKGLEAADCKTNTLFLIDSTGSVSKIWIEQKQYVQKVLSKMNAGQDRVALIVYSSRHRTTKLHGFQSSQTKESISTLTNSIPFFNGITATGAALSAALKELENAGSGAVNLVVVTDGFSFDRVNDQVDQLRKVNNLRTFAVSIGHFYQKSELLQIAGSEDHVFIGANSADALINSLQLCAPTEQKTENLSTTTVSITTTEKATTTSTVYTTTKQTIKQKKTNPQEVNPYEMQESVDLNTKLVNTTTTQSTSVTTTQSASTSTTKSLPSTTQASSTTQVPTTTTSQIRTSTSSELPTTTKKTKEKVDEKKNKQTTKKSKEKTTSKSEKKTNNSKKKNGQNKNVELTDVPVKNETITTKPSKSCILDVIFVLDVSSSVHAAFEQMCDAAVEIYQNLITENTLHYGIVKFSNSHSSKVVVPMGEHKTVDAFRHSLHTISQRGGTTYIVEALKQVQAMLHSQEGHKSLVIVITDGFIRDDPEKDVKDLQSKATVFIVPSAKDFPLNRAELKKMASKERYAFVDRDMQGIKRALTEVAAGC
ncbi:Transmembrane cell adhesion receptor mua-3 [Aphelenchoides besseyi]|nr:Transmembrane cell adhesion receptor mua-3 [Aphelenchoides besseyi]KAI6202386.1 Transmembrane cell adhesion receptor mua-3 [Aphelenchoides besseyi]